MVPNHALIILGLLYGEGDFGRSLMITNTCGWDTDCNSGNLGCLMGIRGGLAGLSGEGGSDWRGPVADRLYLPTADGGRCVTDALSEAYAIANLGRALAGLQPLAPKAGARYHFGLPGSVQGLTVEAAADCSPFVALENVPGHSRLGERSLAVRYAAVGERVVARVAAPTHIAPADLQMPGYELIASPTLYPGQQVRMSLSADEASPGAVEARLYIEYYDGRDQPARAYGPEASLAPGEAADLSWKIPSLAGLTPAGVLIFAVGVEIARPEQEASAQEGVIYLDSLGWDGAPDVVFNRPGEAGSTGKMWRANWVNAVDTWEGGSTAFRLVQNEGRGLLITGSREWTDYRVSARVKPALARFAGLAARVQGLTRFYALGLAEGGKARLIKAYEGSDTVLAEADFAWELWHAYDLDLQVEGSRLRGWVDGVLLFDAQDGELTGGGAALVLEEGHLLVDEVKVCPAG